jgi:hypothetical protein
MKVWFVYSIFFSALFSFSCHLYESSGRYEFEEDFAHIIQTTKTTSVSYLSYEAYLKAQQEPSLSQSQSQFSVQAQTQAQAQAQALQLQSQNQSELQLQPQNQPQHQTPAQSQDPLQGRGSFRGGEGYSENQSPCGIFDFSDFEIPEECLNYDE